MDTQMTLPPSHPPAGLGAPGPVTRFLRAPFEARTWRETSHLLFNLPVGIATFPVIVTGFATGLGMLITLLGIPIIVATVYVSRWMASLERARAKAFLHVDVPPAYRPDPPRDKWRRVHLARSTDSATWVETAGHRLEARRHRGRRGEARLEHPHEARPPADGAGPPPGARGAHVPRRGTLGSRRKERCRDRRAV